MLPRFFFDSNIIVNFYTWNKQNVNNYFQTYEELHNFETRQNENFQICINPLENGLIEWFGMMYNLLIRPSILIHKLCNILILFSCGLLLFSFKNDLQLCIFIVFQPFWHMKSATQAKLNYARLGTHRIQSLLLLILAGVIQKKLNRKLK